MSTEPLERGHEVHVYGPPGTGKTYWLSHQITRSVHERGSDNVFVASFTTAAAENLAGRGLPISKKSLGTLHAHAYRAIEGGTLHTEALDDWNSAYPQMSMSTVRKDTSALDDPQAMDSTGGSAPGDALANDFDSLRNRLEPREHWPVEVARFADRWTDWKRGNGLIDFTDMIEMAISDTMAAPGAPEVGFFDEVQDNTALELKLIRHWGQQMHRIVLAGDDDQMIYGFRGATTDGLIGHPVPARDTIILGQSHRIPASVHRAAELWIRRVSNRIEKEYQPREEEGRCVLASRMSFSDPDPMVRAIEKEIVKLVPDQKRPGKMRPKTVMVIGTCAYMIDPIKHALREVGMPFHNSYRAKRSDWNPLAGKKGAVTASERILAYLAPDEDVHGQDARLWTGDDVRRWAHIIGKRGVFARGAAKALAELPNRELTQEEMLGLFDPDLPESELERALGPDLEWFAHHVATASRKGSEYPLAVAKRRGGAALLEEPQVTIGTIHSVKGGEADLVFLLPDLSVRGWEEWSTPGTSRDGVIRQFYVGMTRARQELVVTAAGDRRFIPPERLVQGAKVA